ncbi:MULTISPECIES: signal recognition particle-docking protein FtsY [Pseudoalteromonas]|uniref:Signal recognition particle receptor FtsY n=1 Tax=Pseudoalteromonas shioyasakiensis TaxID=1190813 RepID=A0ABT6TYX7_9GAMM|nr:MULTISPECIES: signal recognition particle-docking protein FtsY [Pseudoalteromonas]MDI4669114.1 signal recognition particle-docking protein FtsY [Pseudoalteromonas shioyasakiensis]MDI4686190.1 signal recognition particle-docking protein FtsY [Pseudoalteromonas shioyasakiensis]MDI4704480.1 signal recognition particle-docking protein FtsY [Pseudoalteromonas shioyasakiensis]NUJ21924.1 signal recognition particle-docking protein FtsY [Pseudoalteromonas sp. 0802]NUJ31027.1 signal recognition part
MAKKSKFLSWFGFGKSDKQQAEQAAKEADNQKQIEEQQRIEAEKAEAERLEQERIAAEKAEAERLEQERIAAEQAEAERLEQERIAAEKAEAERLEQERIAAEKAEAERLEQERIAAEQAEAERLAQEQQAAEQQRQEQQARLAEQEAAMKLEQERAAAEQAQREAEQVAAQKAEAERLEQERIAAEKAESERLEQERIAAEKAEADRLEQERIAAEKAEAARLEQERIAAEKAEADRLEQERIAAEKAEAARLEQERIAAEKAEAERLEQERIAAEKAEAERLEQERIAAEKAEAERLEQERIAAEKAEAERLEQERIAAEKAEAERLEQERIAAEKAEAERIEQERIAAEKAEAERLEQEKAAQAAAEKPKKEGFFARLKKGLLKTRVNIGSGFASIFSGKKIDDELFEELETQLLTADLGVDTTMKLIDNLTDAADRKQLKDGDALYELMKQEMASMLKTAEQPLVVSGDKKPFVILMVGVNGVGKTTTIGKLAKQFQNEGKSVMLAAGDTFRAAAVEQLQVWGERNSIPVIAQHTGADSASVVFDAFQAAKARNADVLIADTAGRLQNKDNLMQELEKIARVMKKIDPDAPHEVMLTIDAGTGQNAISQVKLFNECVGLTGITLSKLDGTAKGGVIFAVADKFNIPIRYIGVGEGIDDLRTFNSSDFIDALFSQDEDDA